MRSFIRALLRRIDANCSWCGGSGYWNGYPCIQCNRQDSYEDED
jgi:hypothetical protein